MEKGVKSRSAAIGASRSTSTGVFGGISKGVVIPINKIHTKTQQYSFFSSSSSSSKTKKKHHHHRRRAGSADGRDDINSEFQVKVPRKMIYYTMVVFLIVPLFIFAYKETHLHSPVGDNHDRPVYIRKKIRKQERYHSYGKGESDILKDRLNSAAHLHQQQKGNSSEPLNQNDVSDKQITQEHELEDGEQLQGVKDGENPQQEQQIVQGQDSQQISSNEIQQLEEGDDQGKQLLLQLQDSSAHDESDKQNERAGVPYAGADFLPEMKTFNEKTNDDESQNQPIIEEQPEKKNENDNSEEKDNLVNPSSQEQQGFVHQDIAHFSVSNTGMEFAENQNIQERVVAEQIQQQQINDISVNGSEQAQQQLVVQQQQLVAQQQQQFVTQQQQQLVPQQQQQFVTQQQLVPQQQQQLIPQQQQQLIPQQQQQLVTQQQQQLVTQQQQQFAGQQQQQQALVEEEPLAR